MGRAGNWTRLGLLGCGGSFLLLVLALGAGAVWMVVDNDVPLALPDGIVRIVRAGYRGDRDALRGEVPNGSALLATAVQGCVPLRDPVSILTGRLDLDFSDWASYRLTITQPDGGISVVHMTGTLLGVRAPGELRSRFYRCPIDDDTFLEVLRPPAVTLEKPRGGGFLTLEERDGACSLGLHTDTDTRLLARLPAPCPDWGVPAGIVTEDRVLLEVGNAAILFDLHANTGRLVAPLPDGLEPVRYGFEGQQLLVAARLPAAAVLEGGEYTWRDGGRTYTQAPPGRFAQGALCAIYGEVAGAWLRIETLPWDQEGFPRGCDSALDARAGSWLDDDARTLEAPVYAGDETPLAEKIPGAPPGARYSSLTVGGTRYAFVARWKGPLWVEGPSGWARVDGLGRADTLRLTASDGRLLACQDGHGAVLVGAETVWSGTACPLAWPAHIALPSPVHTSRPPGGESTWWVAEPVADGCRVSLWHADGRREREQVLDTACTRPQVWGDWLAVGGLLRKAGVPYGTPADSMLLAAAPDGRLFGLAGHTRDGVDTCVIHELDTDLDEEVVPEPCARVAKTRGWSTRLPQPTLHEGGYSWGGFVTSYHREGLPIDVAGKEITLLGWPDEPFSTVEQGDHLLVCGSRGAVLVDANSRSVIAAFAHCPTPVEPEEG